MIDASGHHLVYGSLRDYLSGAILKDTDDERVRQGLSRLLVEELGYDRHELEPRLRIITELGGKRVQSLIELCARIAGRRLFILRYGPGSLVSREKAAIAAARLLEPAYRIPLAIVTNGRDATLLDTEDGRVLATGMGCIPSRAQAAQLRRQLAFVPYDDPMRREWARRILFVFDEEHCCAGCGPDSP